MRHKRSIISIAVVAIVLVSMCAVCASTSVGAADSGSSTASVNASPPGQPIAAGTGPSACILPGGAYMYVFVKGYDGALWYRLMDLNAPLGSANFGWIGGWVSLGGHLSSSPCAVARSSGYLNVYVRGTDGAVWEKPYYNAAWHDWVKVGGQLAVGTGPGASGWSGREDIFVRGGNNALWHKSYTGSWSNWQNLGGTLTASPAAVSRGTGLIDVHVRGGNGADWHKTYSNGGWSSWATLGGVLAPGTGPALGVWPSLSVFVTGTNGALWQKTWTAASGWSGWQNLGGSLTSSPTAATSGSFYAIEIYVRWSNGNVCQKEYYSGTWHDWQCGMQGPPCQTNCY